MTYLVCSFLGYEEFGTYEEALQHLRKCTAWYCADENYEGDDFETLYNKCLLKKDFGDIGKILQVDAYFCTATRRIPCSLDMTVKNVEFPVKRIL